MHIATEQILLNLKANSRDEVLAELAAAAQGRCPLVPWEIIAELLLEREQQESTGHGNGIAIPHASLEKIEEPILLFGRHRKGINFSAADRKPVHLFVAILVPQHAGSTYLQVLARVSRLLQQPQLRQQLMQADTTADIQRIFSESR